MRRPKLSVVIAGAALLQVGCTNPIKVDLGSTCSTSISVDGVGEKAGFEQISSVTIDGAGVVYVADGSKIRKVAADGQTTTMALSPEFPQMASLTGLQAGPGGFLYGIHYGNKQIFKIAPTGEVTILAGSPYQTDEFTTNGWVDGKGTEARFAPMRDLCVDAQGNVFVADTFNHRIRKVTPDGTVSTIAGGGALGNQRRQDGPLDGPAFEVQFRFPSSIALDASGNLYVSDSDNKRVCKISQEGLVSTLFRDESNDPQATGDIAVEADGSVIFTHWSRIRRVSSAGESTVDYEPALTFGLPSGLNVAPDGSLILRDYYRIFRLPKSGGTLTLLAGHSIPCGPK